MNKRRLSGAITAVALAAACLVAVPTKASADGRSECQRRVERARDHYRKEVHEHGRHSRQAENAKAKMATTWDRCWGQVHSWYDPDRHEWRTDRDWDRNYDWDHDGDRDHR